MRVHSRCMYATRSVEAYVEVQVHCVNVVIGVVLGESCMLYASFQLLFVMML